MPGFIERIARALGSQHDDPQRTSETRNELDDAYARQTELLQQVRKGAASVASSRRQLAEQQRETAAEIDSLTLSAHRLVDQGQSALAREALVRKQTLIHLLAGLDTKHAQLQREEENLIWTATRLQAKVDSIRAKQHTEWAQYSAREASQKVAEALRGIDVSETDAVVRRADALLQSTPDDQAISDDELNQAAAAEFEAIQDEFADRAPAAPGEGSYQQPGGYPAGGPSDSYSPVDKQ